MKGVNKVILIGNLGRDPELQTLEGGTVVAKFPLATTESYKDRNGERHDQTEWHNIVAWRQLAEICGKFMHKGSMVYVEGKLKTTSWTDKDNNKRYRTDIVADTISMLDKRSDSNGAGNFQHTHSENNASVSQPAAASNTRGNDQMDDLPF